MAKNKIITFAPSGEGQTRKIDLTEGKLLKLLKKMEEANSPFFPELNSIVGEMIDKIKVIDPKSAEDK